MIIANRPLNCLIIFSLSYLRLAKANHFAVQPIRSMKLLSIYSHGPIYQHEEHLDLSFDRNHFAILTRFDEMNDIFSTFFDDDFDIAKLPYFR